MRKPPVKMKAGVATISFSRACRCDVIDPCGVAFVGERLAQALVVDAALARDVAKHVSVPDITRVLKVRAEERRVVRLETAVIARELGGLEREV